MAPSQVNLRQWKYLQRQRAYEDKNNIAHIKWNQKSLRHKLKILVGLFSAASVFLPLQTPQTIIDSLDQQGHWKAAHTEDQMNVDRPKCDQQAEQTTEPAHEIPCTPTCLLVKEVLQLSDDLDHLSVHPIFDPARFFAAISDEKSRQQLMPALLLASNVVESKGFYDFVDGFLHSERTYDDPYTVLALDFSTNLYKTNANVRPMRFHLRYDANEGKKMPKEDIKTVKRLLHRMAPKLAYYIEQTPNETVENGEQRPVHGICDPIYNPIVKRVTGNKIRIQSKMFDNMHRTVVFKNGCGGIDFLRGCLGLAITLIHEFGHALSNLEDPDASSRGEGVFGEETYFSPDEPGEIGWALEKHIFGKPEAELHYSDEEVCWWFRHLLKHNQKRKQEANE